MTDISGYIDSNGNFTHTKIMGTIEQLEELIQKYRETEHFKNKTESQKIIMEVCFFPEIIKTGMVPQGFLLELVMPSTKKPFNTSDLEVKPKITFNLDKKYKN